MADDSYFEKADSYLDNALAFSNPKFYKRMYRTDSYDYELSQMGIFFLYSEKHVFIDLDSSSFLSDVRRILLSLGHSKIKAGDFSQFSGALASTRFFLEKESEDREVLDFYRALVKAIIHESKIDNEGN